MTPGALHITPADEPHTDQHSRVPQVVFFENGSFTRTQIAVLYVDGERVERAS